MQLVSRNGPVNLAFPYPHPWTLRRYAPTMSSVSKSTLLGYSNHIKNTVIPRVPFNIVRNHFILAVAAPTLPSTRT